MPNTQFKNPGTWKDKAPIEKSQKQKSYRSSTYEITGHRLKQSMFTTVKEKKAKWNTGREMKTIKSDGVYIKKNHLEVLKLINIIHEMKNSVN